ncbi:sirohydrochlorin chelatase, partial [Leptospira sp. SA-E8]|uniref:sirohydrochlorin chelatase n=1 Tax=Leptospira sp. SA-E8 TaxID=3422259 RepID=UPI003EB7D141
GSRDPLWQAPIEAVAERMRHHPGQPAQVACAYLELMEPDLPTCVADMAGQGVQAITIVPMFLGQGRHAREDLPKLVAALQAQHPQLQFDLRPAIGEDLRVVDSLARLILS